MPSSVERFNHHIDQMGAIPVSFAMGGKFANLGDALSPIIVSMVSGRKVVHAGMQTKSPRLSCVGTILHGMQGGEVHVWGSGSSLYRNPTAPVGEKVLFDPETAANFSVYATRGPISGNIVGPENWKNDPVYGDPVWLLPKYYRPKVAKKWELGVILHLSELEKRELACTHKANFKRYNIPEDLKGSIKLINTLTMPNVGALKDKIDEILSCRRILSTSLHGMVLAESYGIPCYYFGTRTKKSGLRTLELSQNANIDLRLSDLYLGLGQGELTSYYQRREDQTDWDDAISAIDKHWKPIEFSTAPLEKTFPLGLCATEPTPSDDVFDRDPIKACPMTHTHSFTDIFLRSGLRRLRNAMPMLGEKPKD